MKILNRKLSRDLFEAKGQSAAVAAVILVGVASFVCVQSAHRGLLLTRDSYYRDYRMADFWLPLERAPQSAVRQAEAIPGVRRAQARIVKDVNLDVPGQAQPCVGRLISMPEEQGPTANDIHLVSGRYFSRDVLDEVIISDRFARENKLGLGTRIWATMNDRKQPLRIVGTALSPEYVYMIRGTREFLPNPNRFAILWVARDFAEMALGMQAACNEIVGFLDPQVDAKATLARLEQTFEPYGALRAVGRKDQLSNRYLSDEIRGLGVSARIVPPIFLGIAALILSIMLTRIVQKERTVVGVLKAYGYGNAAIGMHYVRFALVLAVGGALLGTALGQWLAGGMMRMYVEFFQFPLLRHRFYPDVFGIALLISVGSGVVGALWAVVGVVRIAPAQAMRPAAPRSGHRLLLERWGALWRRVGFTGKMILRNVSRYKLRSALTVFGITCATAILLLGYFSGDCMDYLIEYQFTKVQREDVRAAFYAERGKAAWFEAQRFPYVRRAEPELSYPFTLTSAWRSKDVVVTGIPPAGRLTGLDTVDGTPIDVGESGLVLDVSTARTLGLRAGDAVVMKPLLGKIKRERTVRVRAVVQRYLGTGGYMNIEALSRVLDESFAVNAVLLKIDAGREAALESFLKDVPAVAAVDSKRQARRQLEETLAASLAINNTLMNIFAGVIAFAIIYNSTIISLGERQRELASLRVLGFKLGELRRILYGENALLAACGAVFGVPVGTLLCRAIVRAYDTDVYRLPFYLSPRTFIVTLVGIACFVLLANMAVRRKVARLDMVEVLKTSE